LSLSFAPPAIQRYEYTTVQEVYLQSIQLRTLKICKLDDFHTEDMVCPLQIDNICVVVGKETGNKGSTIATVAVGKRHFSG